METTIYLPFREFNIIRRADKKNGIPGDVFIFLRNCIVSAELINEPFKHYRVTLKIPLSNPDEIKMSIQNIINSSIMAGYTVGKLDVAKLQIYE